MSLRMMWITVLVLGTLGLSGCQKEEEPNNSFVDALVNNELEFTLNPAGTKNIAGGYGTLIGADDEDHWIIYPPSNEDQPVSFTVLVNPGGNIDIELRAAQTTVFSADDLSCPASNEKGCIHTLGFVFPSDLVLWGQIKGSAPFYGFQIIDPI